MPTFYHATPAYNAASIKRNGFHAGQRGHAGPGIYFCKQPEAAINRARINGVDAVVFMCEIDASDIENVNSQDNWKVDRNDTTLIRQIMTRRYTAAEVRLIKSGVRGISIQQGWQQIQAHGNEESRGVRDELEDADAGALMLMLMRMRLF